MFWLILGKCWLKRTKLFPWPKNTFTFDPFVCLNSQLPGSSKRSKLSLTIVYLLYSVDNQSCYEHATFHDDIVVLQIYPRDIHGSHILAKIPTSSRLFAFLYNEFTIRFVPCGKTTEVPLRLDQSPTFCTIRLGSSWGRAQSPCSTFMSSRFLPFPSDLCCVDAPSSQGNRRPFNFQIQLYIGWQRRLVLPPSIHHLCTESLKPPHSLLVLQHSYSA